MYEDIAQQAEEGQGSQSALGFHFALQAFCSEGPGSVTQRSWVTQNNDASLVCPRLWLVPQQQLSLAGTFPLYSQG